MLKAIPTKGQWVKVLLTRHEYGVPYQTAGDVHEIVGTAGIENNPFFISDDGRKTFVDEAAFDEYSLYEPQDFDDEDAKIIQLNLTQKELTSVIAALSVSLYEDVAEFAEEADIPYLSEEDDQKFYEDLLTEINEQYSDSDSDSNSDADESNEKEDEPSLLDDIPEEFIEIIEAIAATFTRFLK